MSEVLVGTVTDFFAKPVVAAVKISGSVKVGDKFHIKGHSTDMEFIISSMQINNASVNEVKPGDEVGVKVPDRVRKGDEVFKVTS